MSFSRAVRESSLSAFSPNGKLLAVPCAMKVTIYNAISFQQVTTITNADNVDFIKWSPDSKLLMCLLLKRRLVHVWSPEHTSWKCRISEGPLGLISACWSPDSRHILTTADFQIRTTVWSLADKSVLYLKHVKLSLSERSFSQSGDYLAVVERNDAKDLISIIKSSSWTLELSFEAVTKDLADLSWAPNADIFCIWESPRIAAFQLCLYNVAGIQLATYGRSEEIVGIKSLLWSRCGQLVMLESFEGKLTMLETVAWGRILDYVLPESLTNDSVLVFREVKSKQTIKGTIDSHYQVLSTRPVSLKALVNTSNVDVPSHPTAVKLSANQRHMACISATFPGVVFVVDVKQLALAAVLVHLTAVSCIAWDRQSERLAICTGSKHLCLWSPSEALMLQMPCRGPFPIKSCQWNPARGSLLVHGEHMAALCSLSRLG